MACTWNSCGMCGRCTDEWDGTPSYNATCAICGTDYYKGRHDVGDRCDVCCASRDAIRGKPILKGKTRLELKAEERPLTKIDEKAFKAEVRKRDKDRCRNCERKVIYVMDRIPERGEVNHIHGRGGDLRFEVRAAILLCLKCHERFTGKVNEHRLTIIASQTFTTRQGTFTDATYPVQFKVNA